MLFSANKGSLLRLQIRADAETVCRADCDSCCSISCYSEWQASRLQAPTSHSSMDITLQDCQKVVLFLASRGLLMMMLYNNAPEAVYTKGKWFQDSA